MKKEDREFLKELQHEMLTQDNFCQADPRFWVVMQTVKDYWVEDDIDGVSIYDMDAAENVFEGEFEELAKWLEEQFEVIEKCECENGYIQVTCNDENEYLIDDIPSLEEFLTEYDFREYSVFYFRYREEIVPDTMFLTLRECKEHIHCNSHHYNETVHPYAMTAWRSPQVEKLYKILQEVDWEADMQKYDRCM